MPDEPLVQEEAKKGAGTLMAPTTRNLIVGTAIVIILLTVTAWSGTARTESAKKQGITAEVSALAATFKYPLLEANSLLTEAGRERLQPMVVEIAEAGGYKSLVLADPSGTVLASTKGALATGKIAQDDLPKSGPVIGRSEVGLTASAPIKAGASTLGYLFVETDR
jgi:hypothetical protein